MYVRASYKAKPYGRKYSAASKSAARAANKEETKWFDTIRDPKAKTGTTVQPVDTTSDIQLLNATIAAGVTVNDRVAQRIFIKSLHIKGMLQLNPAATVSAQKVSVMLVLRKRTAAALLTSDVIDSQVAGPLYTPNAQYNWNNVPSDIKILRRWNYSLQGLPAGGPTSSQAISVDKIVPIKLSSKFSFVNGLTDNELSIIVVGDQAASATLAANFAYTCRLYFTG